ncbi:hypothetical protein HHI36_012888, partial [Cryptolaemus montrouzieri]
ASNNSEGDSPPKKKKKTPQITFSWTKEDLPEQNGRFINFTPLVNEDVPILELCAATEIVDVLLKPTKNKGVIIVKSVDNEAALLGSTLHGIAPIGSEERYCKTEKSKRDTPCPLIVKQYNKHVGVVDIANALIGLYKCPIRLRGGILLFSHTCWMFQR